MDFNLFPTQEKLLKAVFDPKINIIGFGGGIKGGKTTGGLISLLAFLKSYQGARGIIVRDSLPTLKRNTLPHLYKIKPKLKINKQDWDCDIYDTSKLIFFSENYDADKELNRWKGLDTNAFLLEEANELNEQSFYKAIERCGSWLIPEIDKNKQPPPKIICTFNPARGFIKELFYDRWRNGTLPDNWAFIPSLLEDNPENSDQYKESLKQNLPDWEYKVYVLGDWDALQSETTFVKEFNYDRHVLNEDVEADKNNDIYVCFDFNVNPFCVAVFQHTKTYIHQVDEYYLENCDIYTVCKLLQRDYKHWFDRGMYYINGDASGQNRSAMTTGNVSAYEIIRACFNCAWTKFNIPTTNPGILNSRLLINSIFKNHPNYKINPKCKETIKDFQEVETDNKGKIDKSDLKRTHLLDIVRYYLYANHYNLLDDFGIGRELV